jgi:hypothetical protein
MEVEAQLRVGSRNPIRTEIRVAQEGVSREPADNTLCAVHRIEYDNGDLKRQNRQLQMVCLSREFPIMAQH